MNRKVFGTSSLYCVDLTGWAKGFEDIVKRTEKKDKLLHANNFQKVFFVYYFSKELYLTILLHKRIHQFSRLLSNLYF